MAKEDFVKKEYFVDAALKDVQVQAILDQIGRRFKAGSNIEKETILQILYRIRAEAKEFVNWRDVCSYFSEETTLGEYSKKETYWRNVADNQMIDEAGTIHNQMQGTNGVSLINQSLDEKFDEGLVTRGEQEYFESLQLKGKSVRFKDERDEKVFDADEVIDPKMYDTEYVMSNLVQKTSQLGVSQGRKRGSSSGVRGNLRRGKQRSGSSAYSKPFNVSKNQKMISKEKKKLLKRYWDKQITIPKGPKMLGRKKKETIKERKRREYLESIRREEDGHINKKFKAKDVPMSTKAPLFYNKMMEKEEKSRLNRDKLKQKTLQMQKPFSFVDKDAEKYKNKYYSEGDVNPECYVGFKANNVPEFYAQADSLKFEEEKLRKEKERKTEERKKKLLKKSQMPSRMKDDLEKREKRKKEILKLRDKMFKKNCSFKPKIKGEIPDLDGEYEKIQKELEEKKMTFESTRIEEFGIKTSKKYVPPGDEIEERTVDQKEVKKKFKSINSFLERNFATTKKDQIKAQKDLAKKNKRKLDKLKKMSENKDLVMDKLVKKIVAVKNFKNLLGGLKKKKEEEDNGFAGGFGFQFDQEEEATNAMGIPSQPKKEAPKKDNFLFKPKRKSSNTSKVLNSFHKKPEAIVTNAQRLIQEKKEEEEKERLKVEKRKKRQHRKAKKHEEEAKKKVREKFVYEGDTRNLDEEVKKKREDFKGQDTEYQIKINRVNQKVNQKMLLVEKRGHTSKMMAYYRRLMSSELGMSIKRSSQASQNQSQNLGESLQSKQDQADKQASNHHSYAGAQDSDIEGSYNQSFAGEEVESFEDI